MSLEKHPYGNVIGWRAGKVMKLVKKSNKNVAVFCKDWWPVRKLFRLKFTLWSFDDEFFPLQRFIEV